MATLESNDSNILDAEEINWRAIVYPALAVAVLIVGGVGYYYYEQDQRNQIEAKARAASLTATTPDDLVAAADKFPNTDQATLALLSAADGSFTKRDFDGAAKVYQRVISNSATSPEIRDSAQLGLASSLEAAGKLDDAINTYLVVAHEGDKSPYAPYAYYSAARIYLQRNDKDKAREILTEASSLDPASEFVKQAQYQLKQLNAAMLPPMTAPVPANAAPLAPSAPTANAAPTAPTAPATK